MPLPKPPSSRGSKIDPLEFSQQKTTKLKKETTEVGSDKSLIEEEVAVVEIEKPAIERVPETNDIRLKAGKAKSSASKAKVKIGKQKIFVLDTNVLLHDPSCIFNFAEHHVYLPTMVLEELDNHKKGLTDTSRNARQISRYLDELLRNISSNKTLDGVALSSTGNKGALGNLYFQTPALKVVYQEDLPRTPDNQILAVVKTLTDVYKGKNEVVLVSNDINMRIKAHALSVPAEDYSTDKALDDADLLYTGHMKLSNDFWESQSNDVKSWTESGVTHYELGGSFASSLHINQFIHLGDKGPEKFAARVIAVRGSKVNLKVIKDYGAVKNTVFGINTRNVEQNFAMNLLMDPEIDFVTLAGQAGSGKTLLAIAAALEQVFQQNRYSEIIMTRATVSVGEEIGFLPGTEEEKMNPWMGALDDNLEFLTKGSNPNGNQGRSQTVDALRERIKIKSMSFMRGRTFLNKFLIIDEAQNLTPKQIKTLITRAGPKTKIVCMGNLAQIDTPYLTEGSSGLTFAVDRFKGWPHGGHITLQRGERSRLADFAADVMGG